MRKSDKKIDNHLRRVLTDVCELALDQISGFKWLTHFARYENFPESLNVICIFDTNSNLAAARASGDDIRLRNLINDKLLSASIKLKDMTQQVNFDTEESCSIQNNGKWNQRFNKFSNTK